MADRQQTEDVAATSSIVLRFIAGISWLGGCLSALLILLVLIISCYAIVQRYIANTPLLWGDEMLGYLLVAIVMLGAAEALRGNHHIAIDLLSSRVTGVPGKILSFWFDFSVIVFAIILGISTWEAISFAHGFGSYSAGYIEIETWIPQVPMLVGCILLGLVALGRLLAQFMRSTAK